MFDMDGLTLREKCLHSEFFWSVFSRIWIEYGETLRISPHSVQIRENTDHKNSEYGDFSRGVKYVSFDIFTSSFSSTEI